MNITLIYNLQYLSLQYYFKQNQMQKRKPLIKQKDDENYQMTVENIKICIHNQEGYATPELNDALHLQYYGFVDIINLQPFFNIIALYLNNNVIEKVANLGSLKKLITLNLSNNRIQTIENLQNLRQLVIVDLSGNKIETVSGLNNLSKLQNLNLSHNLLKTANSVTELPQSQNITFVNLNNNPLEDDPTILQILNKLPKLLTLYMKDTPFNRGIKNYRRETICKIKTITYLDDRPVTYNQRLLAEAWKEGGIMREKQVKKTIRQSHEIKNKKILDDIMERQATVKVKRDQLYDSLTKTEQDQLNSYKGQLSISQRLGIERTNNENTQKQIKLLDRQIQQLELYLQEFRESVKYMNLQPSKQVPTNIIYDIIDNCVVVYGVKQQNIQKITQTFFPNETRTIVARNYQKAKQSRWINQYQKIIEQMCEYHKDSPQLLLPSFNIEIHKFDKQFQRKPRRFEYNQLKDKIQLFNKQEESQTKQYEQNNQLNQLD